MSLLVDNADLRAMSIYNEIARLGDVIEDAAKQIEEKTTELKALQAFAKATEEQSRFIEAIAIKAREQIGAIAKPPERIKRETGGELEVGGVIRR